MARSQRKNIRKLVTLPPELADRIDKFRQEIGASSESDALKLLIENGFKLRDRPADLYAQFEAAIQNGETIGGIITIASEHPLVESAFINGNEAVIHLKVDGDPQKFVFDRSKREWDWLRTDSDGYGNDDRWFSIRPGRAPERTKPKADLDDEIPF